MRTLVGIHLKDLDSSRGRMRKCSLHASELDVPEYDGSDRYRVKGGKTMDYHHPIQPRPMELARAYVCPQPAYAQRFNPIEGLKHGTIFPELVRPYVPERERQERPGEVGQSCRP